MALTPDELSQKLMKEGQRSLAFFESIHDEQWDTVVYSDETSWTVNSILSHFLATEIGILSLVRDILSGGNGAIEDFDLNLFNNRKVNALEFTSIDELLDRFRAAREDTIKLVQSMSQDDLQKSGRHPWLGVTTLEVIIRLMYQHNQIHQRDIRRIIGATIPD